MAIIEVILSWAAFFLIIYAISRIQANRKAKKISNSAKTNINPNASVTDFRTVWNGKNFTTYVTFSDGFTYTSNKEDADGVIGIVKKTVTPEMKSEILYESNQAHSIACFMNSNVNRVVICPNCGHVSFTANKRIICNKCLSAYYLTNISAQKWDEYGEEEKKKTIEYYKDKKQDFYKKMLICPKCGSTFSGGVNDRYKPCSDCGWPLLKELPILRSDWRQLSESEKNEYKNDFLNQKE